MNNLDEFFRVRVATVRRMISLGKKSIEILGGYTPKKLLDQIQKIVIRHQNQFQQIYNGLLKELESYKIFVINEKLYTS